MLQTGEGRYRIIDGAITNCHLPRPDWQVISRSIDLAEGKASTSNAFFKFLNVPVFYLPYLRHPTDETGRESGLMIPSPPSNYSSVRGYTMGEQVYWVIGRNMDLLLGSEYYSKRGWAPNGDFRYRGAGLDSLAVNFRALLDRGIELAVPATAAALASTQRVNQGGVEIDALGRKDFGPETRLAGSVQYLSSYVYRLVFNDNFSQAMSSEVQSTVSLTHTDRGIVPSVSLDRFQTFASSANGDEARIIHLPSLRFDSLDRPLGSSWLYWGMGSSLGYLTRSEPGFHARNAVRIDLYPHLSLPLVSGGWSLVPEVAVRDTSYTISQIETGSGVPTISHDPLSRKDFEASVDLRAPVLVRDFALTRWGREMRHVIEPEITYRYVAGIGTQAQNVLLIDTTDIATNTNEAGFSLTQRLYLRPASEQHCGSSGGEPVPTACPPRAREWASWQLAQKFFINRDFGGAIIPNRRNVFDSTLDLTGVAFLTSPRSLSPITSRLRFEAIDNLRIEWDMDYDPKAGRLEADNLYAGYSWGRTTVGVGHALLNAVDENGSAASTLQSQQVQPFLSIGKVGNNGLPTGTGLSLAASGSYDFVLGQLQYGAAQATYNWDCCGLTFGYRRFSLGSIRDETQWLYSFTLANFGSVGDIRRTNSAFRDPSLPPAY
jgi:LPS-assembly protein